MDEQAAKGVDADVAIALVDFLYDLGEHFHSLFDGEEGLFLRVDENADDNLVEELAPAFDDVQVAVGDGVKRTGIDGAAHASDGKC
jgi:hypothetical protein